MTAPNENCDGERSSVIVVVAKCPIPGKSKTRLIPLLGLEGSALLAKAMLSDVLSTLSHYKPFENVVKMLFYAPGNQDGEEQMKDVLRELGVLDQWKRVPMLLSNDMTSSDLSAQLVHAMKQAESFVPSSSSSIVFLGMDSPELPLEEIVGALQQPPEVVTLCPSADGGYGMMCLPLHCQTVFANVQWSHPLTALSQIKAVTDANLNVRLGRLMHDMDEPQDVKDLAQRLLHNTTDNDKNLSVSSCGTPHTSDCPRTTQALMELGVLNRQVYK